MFVHHQLCIILQIKSDTENFIFKTQILEMLAVFLAAQLCCWNTDLGNGIAKYMHLTHCGLVLVAKYGILELGHHWCR